MHENGFIHRDIKPENILLKSGDKLLKIGDFGNTCSVSSGQSYSDYVATRWYRSPECILTSGWYGTKMDIWATGCVLYEIAVGRPLFDGQDENDQMEKIDRILGHPNVRLLSKFRKHSSTLFNQRYNGTASSVTPGLGLHSVYQPFKPAYDVMKDMIVYDPVKRYSVERLLRKSYFWEIKYTQYDYEVRKFRGMLIKDGNQQSINRNLTEMNKVSKNDRRNYRGIMIYRYHIQAVSKLSTQVGNTYIG